MHSTLYVFPTNIKKLYKKIQKNEYAASVGGVAKLMKLRMQDVGKTPFSFRNNL